MNLSQKEHNERRKHIRFKLKEGVMATVRYNEGVVGTIIDISLGGLALQYINLGKELTISQGQKVYLCDKKNRLIAITCDIVWDKAIEGHYSAFKVVEVRQSGVHFHEVEANQVLNLDNFITNNI
ncbi:MAG: PilZ domain-containing protein [Proteobacteria bacterium]|nr:PilZ domain-containing protein [Pseudomonadota bacterium]MBU1710434.1 PilZ domain-containing protein [Pseudomonadota bacterium]